MRSIFLVYPGRDFSLQPSDRRLLVGAPATPYITTALHFGAQCAFVVLRGRVFFRQFHRRPLLVGTLYYSKFGQCAAVRRVGWALQLVLFAVLWKGYRHHMVLANIDLGQRSFLRF